MHSKNIVRSSISDINTSCTATHRPVVHVDLVAEQNEGEVLGVARTRLDEEFVAPAVECLEGGGRRDVIDEHTAVGATVERDSEALKPFLARRVPDLAPQRSDITPRL